ncbi:hypothetical protein PACTADRAFT_51666 [Pachysolen tannophilus NRRL Y-2460]|uniref:Uncharacterized protein n=1 Tax=Pachysolen tannophilus NRRL Y-2460 TaxID=669874 RepID=A0A1E4TQC5_PACTA|nr:hypothetical protein PACTADRAFT_51666 [Pachysolen tannophilus NRRL Y-2460]
MTNNHIEDDSLHELRQRLQKEASRFYKGVTNGDVDWLLRGDNVNANIDGSPLADPPALNPDIEKKSTPTVASDDSQVLLRGENIDSRICRKDSNGLRRTKTIDGNPIHKTFTNNSVLSNDSSNVLTRPRSYSTSAGAFGKKPSDSGSSSSGSGGGGGFFKKLLGRKKVDPVATGSLSPKMGPRSSSPNGSPRQMSVSDETSSYDPKLEEYLKYYKKKQSLVACYDNNRKSMSKKTSIKTSDAPVKYDAAGQPIPPHPDVAPLPPAIVNHSPITETRTSPVESTISMSSRFNILRRHHTNSETMEDLNRSPSNTDLDEDYVTHISNSNISHKSERIPQITVLQQMQPLRKVAFAADVFVHDPPQQIPSRNPRKGNVEIEKDGTIKIHPLKENEKKQDSGGGLVVGGTGALRILSNEEQALLKKQADSQAAASAAMDRAANGTEDSADTRFTDVTVQIDKPMVSRHKLYDENGHYIMDKPAVKLQLDELYTRCCHLREILPIPAVLKQIPPHTTDPLMILRLRNPRPSLIEVLAFSDFVRIAPIICVSLDGVSLSLEMFRIILGAMVYKRHLEKLSLRNTPIDAEGWKVLCWFLSINKRLRRIDITQCPAVVVNTQKLRKSSKSQDKAKRMVCNLNNRSDMDWDLMAATLVTRGGIEDIILTGCKIPSFATFKNFMEQAVSISTMKLGLAYNSLTLKQLEVIAKWMERNANTAFGLDIGYNDLSFKDALVPFIKYATENVEKSCLKFLSLSSTNLYDNDDFRTLIVKLSSLKELKFLDLSNNKRLFPSVNEHLATYLPLFPSLSRLHLDSNDLDSKSIVTFAEMMTLCSKLCYFSIAGNHLDTAASMALVAALRTSTTIFTLDLDYFEMPTKLREKIGLYTMRNMEQILYGKNKDIGLSTAIIPKKCAIMKTSLTDRLLKLLHDKKELDPGDEEAQSVIVEARELKKKINETMNELFKLQINNKLNLEGKETLIRLCYIDSSLEKGLSLINSKLAYQTAKLTDYNTSEILSERKPCNYDKNNADGLQHDDHGEVEIKDDDKSIVGRSSSRTSLVGADKGEGSVLKFSQMISPSDRNVLNDSDSDLSGDLIEKLLLNPTDLALITQVLTTLKARGLKIEDIYSKGNFLKNELLQDEKTALGLEALKNEINNIKTDLSKDGSNKGSTDDKNDNMNNYKKRETSISSAESASFTSTLIEANTESNKHIAVERDDSVSSSSSSNSYDNRDKEVDEEVHAISRTYDSLLKDLAKKSAINYNTTTP